MTTALWLGSADFKHNSQTTCKGHEPIAALSILGLLPCSWRPLVVILIVVVFVLVTLLMALVVAAVLLILVGGIGIVVSPVICEQKSLQMFQVQTDDSS